MTDARGYEPSEYDVQAALLSAIVAPADPIPEPLPCPFDGAHAVIKHESGSYGYSAGKVYVKCTDPHCRAESRRFDDEDYEPGVGMYSTLEKAKGQAVAWWNRRDPKAGSVAAHGEEGRGRG